jgi:four helix bundle protein
MFVAYEVSVQLVQSLRELVPLIERSDRDLADQLRRAASSVVLNLAEGQRSTKGNRHKHYAIAHGSANEVKAALELARAWGWIDSAGQAPQLLDQLLRLLWGLTHRSQNAAAPTRSPNGRS